MVAIVIRQPTRESIARAKGQAVNPQPVTLTAVATSRRESDDGRSVLVASAHTVGQAFHNAIRGLATFVLPSTQPAPQGKRARKPLTDAQRARKRETDRARRLARKACAL